RRGIVERAERRRRDFILAQHFLRERLAAFQPRGFAAGREDFEAALLKKFGDAEGQRQLGALADAVVARRDEYFLDARALAQLPDERVLAPAAADDEDFHVMYPVRASCRD